LRAKILAWKTCAKLILKKEINLAKSKLDIANVLSKAQDGLRGTDIESLKVVVVELVAAVIALSNRLGVNSSNSSKPPSADPNRKRPMKAKGRRRKAGGQKGHVGSFLNQVPNPTTTKDILIDRDTLPKGRYHRVGFETRQVFDVEVTVHVTEFRGEILENAKGEQFVANFPKGVTEPAQYGNSVKATSVYMSQFQLVPLARVQDHFRDQIGLPLSKGSVSNWNALAFEKLESFEIWARRELIKSICCHADETGINVNGKRLWLHSVSSEKVTLFHADEKRGAEAMERMGVIPFFKGILVHDHWKAYFAYACAHALCNAHHLRELEAAIEFDGQKWAKKMQDFLVELNKVVDKSGGSLSKKRAAKFYKRYRRILAAADRECPLNKKSRAQTKSRNLLERLRDFEVETLRFVEDINTPFTNNLGENDLRMTKVQQKISGCFRSMDGARIFCRIRSYLSTCRKNGVGPTEALTHLFDGKLPAFIT
jgi:transposase